MTVVVEKIEAQKQIALYCNFRICLLVFMNKIIFWCSINFGLTLLHSVYYRMCVNIIGHILIECVTLVLWGS